MKKSRLFDYLTEKVDSLPDANFLAEKKYDNGSPIWRSYTYKDTQIKAKRLATALLSLGIKKGDMIGISANNRPEWNFVDLGCQFIGAVLVPLYPTASENDFAYILNDAEVKYMFVSDKGLYQKVQSIKSRVPSLIETYVFDDVTDAVHWETILSEKPDSNQIDIASATVSEDDLATIIYTSGTTGNPKGVMLTHKNMVANLRSTESILPFMVGKRSLSFLPLCHVFERIVFFAYLSQGLHIHYAESLETIGENLKEVKPFCFTTVPRLLEKVYEKIMEKGMALTGLKRKLFFWSIDLGLKYDLNKPNGLWYDIQLAIARKLVFSKWHEALGGEIKFIVTGAAPFQARLFRLFSAADIAVIEGYGLSESSPGICINRYEPEGRRMGTVGEALPGVQVKIAEDGEILAKGDNIMKGYFKRPDLTAEVIDADGWLHTGDIGEWVEGKFLKITDRKKELFKTSGGKYVAPQPIENKIKESRYVEQAMLVGDGEKFVSILIVPSFLILEAWAQDEGVSYSSKTELLAHLKVKALFEKAVADCNECFGQVEKIKKYVLLADEWTIERGELTPTLKLKRKALKENNKEIIAKLYNE
jgi:long-chain acyl-CoA synthetase